MVKAKEIFCIYSRFLTDYGDMTNIVLETSLYVFSYPELLFRIYETCNMTRKMVIGSLHYLLPEYEHIKVNLKLV